MQYEFSELTEDTLTKLYQDFGFTAKEIGGLVGLSESSILLKIKKLSKNQQIIRASERLDISVTYTGKDNTQKKDLTYEILEEMCSSGMSDLEIGSQFGMTGEGVAYRRKKANILSAKERRDPEKLLKLADKKELEEDYLQLTQEAFSVKYQVSKTIWRPYLQRVGIQGKVEQRVNSYPPLTLKQKSLIIGSLLGDGSVSQGNYFYEFHSKKQKLYLSSKATILEPYSKPIYPSSDDTGYVLQTIHHPVFSKFYNSFYQGGGKGKHISCELIKKYWDDCVLAYWFFDDGHYDETAEVAWICNKCPIKEQLLDLVSFINERYNWQLSVKNGTNLYLVTIPKKNRDSFFNIVKNYATPDLLYKIPEHMLDRNKIGCIDFNSSVIVRPKLYRVSSDNQKKEIENRLFREYRKMGFPFVRLTETYKKHLLGLFKKSEIVVDSDTVRHSSSGIKLCESFFPNIYSCCRSGYTPPVVSWEDDRYLINLIKNRLKYAKLISNATMRAGVKLTKASVTNFKPMVARTVYQRHGKGLRVLDYSAGFGARMLAAAVEGCHYTGYDPSVNTAGNLKTFGTFINEEIGFRFNIFCEPFEKATIVDKFDLAFSCPPYYDFELYGQDIGQSVLSYKDRQSWLNNYWKATITKAISSLDVGGVFSACLSPYICGDMIEVMFDVCREAGFGLDTEYKIPFPDVIRKSNRYEIVFIFRAKDRYRFSSLYPVSGTVTESRIQDKVFENIRRNKVWHIDDHTLEKVKQDFKNKGITSRGAYKETGINGIPIHVLEHRYGSWNAFVRAAGLEPGYEAKSYVERVREYFEACKKAGHALSFYEYEKFTGNPSTRLKRIFNKGKPFNHFKELLFDCAMDDQKKESFLKLLVPDKS